MGTAAQHQLGHGSTAEHLEEEQENKFTLDPNHKVLISKLLFRKKCPQCSESPWRRALRQPGSSPRMSRMRSRDHYQLNL